MTTAAARVVDHLHRRRRRHPALPRLPDRAARREVDLPRGRLPADLRRAARRRAVRRRGSARSRTTRSSTRTCASASSTASTTTPTRWACCLGRRRALDVLPGRARTSTTRRSATSQIVRLIAKMPTLAAAAYRFSGRHAVRLPGQLARLPRELPVDDVEGRRAALRGRPRARAGDRRAVHPARRPRAELLDHHDARRRLEPRRPVLATAAAARRPLRPAARRRQRGRAGDARARSARSRTSRRSSRR